MNRCSTNKMRKDSHMHDVGESTEQSFLQENVADEEKYLQFQLPISVERSSQKDLRCSSQTIPLVDEASMGSEKSPVSVAASFEDFEDVFGSDQEHELCPPLKKPYLYGPDSLNRSNSRSTRDNTRTLVPDDDEVKATASLSFRVPRCLRKSEKKSRNKELSVSEHLPCLSLHGCKTGRVGGGALKKTQNAFGKVKNKLKFSSQLQTRNEMKMLGSVDTFEAEHFSSFLVYTESLEPSQASISKKVTFEHSTRLQRSLSLSDIGAEADEETDLKVSSEEPQKPNSSAAILSSRRNLRRQEELSVSEHVPRLSSSGNIQQSSRSQKSKELSVFPANTPQSSSTNSNRTRRVYHREKTWISQTSTKKEGLSQSEHAPATRSSSYKSKPSGPVEDLDLQSSSRSSDYEAESNFRPHFSLDLSQLIEMETLLEEEEDKKRGTRNEKLKKAFANVKKRITGDTGARRNDMKQLSSTNVSIFEDSYMEAFDVEAWESIASKSRPSLSRSQSPTHIVAGTTPLPPKDVVRSKGLSGVGRRKPSSSREWTTSSRQERLPSSLGDLRSPSGRRPAPKTRLRGLRGRRAGLVENKPSSWRELYGKPPTNSSSTRRTTVSQATARRRLYMSRKTPPSPSEDKQAQTDGIATMKPRSRRPCTSEAISEGEAKNEEFTATTPPPKQQRPHRRAPDLSLSRKNGASPMFRRGERDLERIQW